MGRIRRASRVLSLQAVALSGFALFALSLGAAQAEPQPAPVEPSLGRVDVTLELPKDKPYVGEMIMLRMRSFVRAFIVLDEIKQPPLTNFDWQQLGRDKPIQAMVDGFSVAGVERDIAIFPQQSGRLIIDPFVRRVTIVTDDNRRVQVDYASKPVFVDVQNHTAVQSPDVWWLPAKSVSLTDTWSVAPDEIKPGTLARRTITVQALGLTADRLPPPPTITAPGTIAFKGPAVRDTLITEDGPIARATYQWDIRPVSSSPAQLQAINMPWFDTSERRVRTAAIPSLWVAYIGTLVHTSHEKVRTFAQTYFSAGPVTAAAGGFAWTAAVTGLAVAGLRRRNPIRRRLLRRVRRTARFQDEWGLRAALLDLARHDPTRWAHVLREEGVKSRLAALDAVHFARMGGGVPPLKPLADDVIRLFDGAEDPAAPSSALVPLDGPLRVNARTGWRRWLPLRSTA